MSNLSSKINLPLAVGERNAGIWEFKEYAELVKPGFFKPDIAVAGGITGVKKISNIAHKHNISVEGEVGIVGYHNGNTSFGTDIEEAKKYSLEIIKVVSDGKKDPLKEAYTGNGKLINSDFLNNLDIGKPFLE